MQCVTRVWLSSTSVWINQRKYKYILCVIRNHMNIVQTNFEYHQMVVVNTESTFVHIQIYEYMPNIFPHKTLTHTGHLNSVPDCHYSSHSHHSVEAQVYMEEDLSTVLVRPQRFHTLGLCKITAMLLTLSLNTFSFSYLYSIFKYCSWGTLYIAPGNGLAPYLS